MYCFTSFVVNKLHIVQSPSTPELHTILLVLLLALIILPVKKTKIVI